MVMFWRLQTNKYKQQRLLYAIVFGNRLMALPIMLLLAALLLQPVHTVFASTAVAAAPDDTVEVESTASAEESADDVSASDAQLEPEPEPEPAAASATSESVEAVDVSAESSPETTTENDAVSEDVVIAPSTPEPATDADTAASTTENTSMEGANDAPEAPLDTSVTDTVTLEPASESELNAAATGGEFSDNVLESTTRSSESTGAQVSTDVGTNTHAASTTTDTEVGSQVALSSAVTTDENYHQFSRHACVEVGDGAFHCTTSDTLSVDPQAAVFVDQSESGVLDIYMRTSKGTVEQITNNAYDDTAPFYDADGAQIVWQRLIDGRQQIMHFDLTTKAEIQLTDTRTNNMEPTAAGQYVVWQSWDGSDWEITLFDGETTTVITNNDVQDVSPVIQDGYVLWTVLGESEQLAKVYDLSSGQTFTITDHEGGTILNPRFVLVYDTKFANGDIITHGFDPTTGLSAPITATPAAPPVDIPDTDSTGETRALIQNKSVQREDVDNEEGVKTDPIIDDMDGLIVTATTSASSTTSSTPTLDLSQATSSLSGTENSATSTDDVVTQSATTTEIFALSEYDLIIEPVATSTQE